MHNVITAIKSRPVLCTVLALVLVGAVVMVSLIVSMMSSAQQTSYNDPAVTDSAAVTETSLETEALSEIVTETETEAVTEEPLPYYAAEGDTPYYPSEHIADYFEPIRNFSEDYRIYAARPHSDSEAFNEYCEKTLTSMISSMESPATAREGGTTVVTVDYTLYLAKNVYSAVFVQKLTDTETHKITKSVVVLIYNVERNTVYAPLDLFDMTVASEPLAAKIRAGYEEAFRACALKVDEAFLDEVCTPDPSSFVNIAADAKNMYFFTVYGKAVLPEVLCAVVPFADMTEYTWAAIEAKRQAEQQAAQQPQNRVDYVDIPVYDMSAAVQESDAVGNDYFDDAVFIGNSLIVGFQRMVPLNARYFASIGLNVSQVFTKQIVPMTSGDTATISEALGTVEFSKVYLMFGINELGWGSIASFINYYGQIIDRVREVNPEAIVYVQSILPINEEKWAKSRDYQSCINNYAVAAFNQKILDMCVEKGAAFVNVGEALKDENGNLFADATSDGIHIGGAYATTWVDYLKTHTVSAP